VIYHIKADLFLKGRKSISNPIEVLFLWRHLDAHVKSLQGRHSREACPRPDRGAGVHKWLSSLDSRFRGNDENVCFLTLYEIIKFKRGYLDMKVVVRDNQIEKAIRDLKRKLTKEGFFSEIKERRFYDKPSVQKKKKQAKAAKRRRKRVRRF